MMRRIAVVGSIAFALVAGGLVGEVGPGANATTRPAAEPSSRFSQLFGFSTSLLVRVDPATLRPLAGRRIEVGAGGCTARLGGTSCWATPPWTVSPDARRLAVARNDVSSLKIIDASPMRVAASVRWDPDSGSIGALAWLVPGRMLAVQEAVGEAQRLVAFDLARGRIAVRRALGGTVTGIERTSRELILLIAPSGSIGTARIAVADARGRVRFTRLDQIVAGSKVLGRVSEHRIDARTPGLAVDPERRRAFVVAQSVVAEIDLRTLVVSYHSLDAARSLVGRLWNWLEPAAVAKQVNGYHRQAQWLGGDAIAVSGVDTEVGRHRPAGLRVLDAQTWKLRTLEQDATTFEFAEGQVLATGWKLDEQGRAIGIGLAAYGPDGAKRFHVFAGLHAWPAEVVDGRAYVTVESARDRLHIVDLASGTVTGVREPVLPKLLLGAGSGWWD